MTAAYTENPFGINNLKRPAACRKNKTYTQYKKYYPSH